METIIGDYYLGFSGGWFRLRGLGSGISLQESRSLKVIPKDPEPQPNL